MVTVHMVNIPSLVRHVKVIPALDVHLGIIFAAYDVIILPEHEAQRDERHRHLGASHFVGNDQYFKRVPSK